MQKAISTICEREYTQLKGIVLSWLVIVDVDISNRE